MIEKEKKLNEALSELKNLDLSNPDLKNNIKKLN
jgi:5-formyltetrahydrofolate cyclo-ligase